MLFDVLTFLVLRPRPIQSIHGLVKIGSSQDLLSGHKAEIIITYFHRLDQGNVLLSEKKLQAQFSGNNFMRVKRVET